MRVMACTAVMDKLNSGLALIVGFGLILQLPAREYSVISSHTMFYHFRGENAESVFILRAP